MLRIILVLVITGLSMPAFGQVRAEVGARSRVFIDGRSTISKFSCKAGELAGEAVFTDEGADASVTVPVQQFDCGKSRMNHDLQKAMKADRHPEVRFDLERAEMIAPEGQVTVFGRLSIAGVTRNIALPSRVSRTSPGRYRLEGELNLQMSDFGIDPPSALAGLIRAHNEIVVRFDVFATIEDPTGLRYGSSRYEGSKQTINNVLRQLSAVK